MLVMQSLQQISYLVHESDHKTTEYLHFQLAELNYYN